MHKNKYESNERIKYYGKIEQIIIKKKVIHNYMQV